MLAARCAWTVLESEHAHMRGLLATMRDLLATDGWRGPGAAHARLVRLVDELRSFDSATHRPKGTAMMQAMSGRSAPADLHLAQMQRERERDDALLAQATGLLTAVADGDAGACDPCRELLARYGEGLMLQMEQEETLLRAHAEQVLTQEEWSQVASAISSSLYAPPKDLPDAADLAA